MKKNRNAGPACPHCGAPKRCHPIDEPKRKREKFPRVCMIEYNPPPQSPLPFELRSLNDDDKVEIQEYLQRLPSGATQTPREVFKK